MQPRWGGLPCTPLPGRKNTATKTTETVAQTHWHSVHEQSRPCSSLWRLPGWSETLPSAVGAHGAVLASPTKAGGGALVSCCFDEDLKQKARKSFEA